MNFAGVVWRKATVLPIAAALVVAAVGFVVLSTLNNPANGRLRHDGSLQTTTVEKQWQVKCERYDACLDIRFKGKVSGNARSTWGITGPTTVWDSSAGGPIRTDGATGHGQAALGMAYAPCPVQFHHARCERCDHRCRCDTERRSSLGSMSGST
ncbi:MAG: hypothetical protein L0K86_02475 [Actinomycetia bacterium]|nr:hypothetical protein [Actinomycetes bacterium]